MQVLTLNVRYSLPEYLAVMEAFVPYALTAKKEKKSLWEVRRPSVHVGFVARSLVKLIASVAFVYKVWSVGECKFTFSESGLVREAKDGEVQVPWPNVTRVFRLPTAYLFAKANGAMPVPYICMTNQQQDNLEKLLAQVGHGTNNAA